MCYSFFDKIEKVTGQPGLMSGNREQHAAFHGGLDAYLAYTAAVESGAEKYDGKKLRSLLDAFMPTLQEHLEDEITDLMALEKYEDKTDWPAWIKKVQQEIIAAMQANPDSKVRSLDLLSYCVINLRSTPSNADCSPVRPPVHNLAVVPDNSRRRLLCGHAASMARLAVARPDGDQLGVLKKAQRVVAVLSL